MNELIELAVNLKNLDPEIQAILIMSFVICILVRAERKRLALMVQILKPSAKKRKSGCSEDE